MRVRLRQAVVATAVLAVLGVQAVSTGGPAAATTTPNFSIGDASVVEGELGMRLVKVPVTLSSASASDVTVVYTVAAGSATAGTDYKQPKTSKTLTFKAGVVNKSISVTFIGDALVEPNETVTVTLSSPGGAYVIGRGVGTATALNDDANAGVKVSIGDVTVVEGDLALKPRLMQFAVTLNTASAGTVTVDYATADGTARIDQNDYTTKIGHIVFTPGSYKKLVSVKFKGDDIDEYDETFSVVLENAVGATLARPVATATILSDEFSTATSLTSSPNPSTTGQSVTLTATVTSFGGTPPGTVSFFDGLTPLGSAPLSGGVAQMATSSLSDGVHSLVASYVGTYPYRPSQSNPHSHTVGGAAVACAGGTCGWGGNSYGQIGDGTTADQYAPVSVAGDNDRMAAGGKHSLAVRDGALWAWGDNDFGQLGDGTTTDRVTPVQIGTATDWDVVSAGSAHSLAIKENGTLWAFGMNLFGQLGDGTTLDKLVPTQIGIATDWREISAGGMHSLGTRGTGTLYGWGNNGDGQVGDGTTVDNRTVPTQVGVVATWGQVDAGENHSLAIRGDGELWAWGDNFYGQVGDGSTTDRTAPVRIGVADDWLDIAAGGSHSLALRENPTGFPNLFAWGGNEDGQLGDGTTARRLAPIQIAPGAHEFANVDAGRAHSVTSDADGGYQTWGDNESGQLGDGTNIDRLTPATVFCCVVTGLVAGGDHNLGVFPTP